jgi:succinyl-CoA synthetase beta subunit
MARLYEYQGKEILKNIGIPVPEGKCAVSAKEVRKVAEGIGKELIGQEIKGLKVEKVLVEEQLEVDRELYAGVIVSNSYKVKGPVFIFSSEGGTSIEEVSERSPERISRLDVDFLKGLSQEDALRLISDVSFNSAHLSQDFSQKLAEIICGVYTAFRQYDARNIEVNPLIITKKNQIIAADCHVTIDDNSVFRHPELGIELPRDMERPPTELEKKAWTIEDGDYRGTGYFAQMVPKIEGEGWLGFHGIGGGGAMLGASAFVARGLKIANYADTSGDPPASKIYRVIKCILSQPIDGYVLMGACLANQEQWHHAHALVKAFREEAKKRSGFPVLMLIGGNKERETHEIIKEGFKDLPLRWELYGREYIYDTDFIANRVEALVKDYQKEK